MDKKSRLFWRFFQYSVLWHYSKCFEISSDRFNKNRVFNKTYKWLQLRQILKNFTRENARKLALIFSLDVTKISKICVVSRVGVHLGVRWCDTRYRMPENKSKLELFYRLFIEVFWSYFVGPNLKHIWMKFETIGTNIKVI